MINLVAKQFRLKNKKQRKWTNIRFIIGIILIFLVPKLMSSSLNNSFQKPLVSLQKVESNQIKAESESKLNDNIDLYLINSNKCYCSVRKGNNVKLIILAKAEIEKLVRKFPDETYLLKACNTAEYTDVKFVIDILSKNKVKRYALLDLDRKDSLVLDKFKKMDK